MRRCPWPAVVWNSSKRSLAISYDGVPAPQVEAKEAAAEAGRKEAFQGLERVVCLARVRVEALVLLKKTKLLEAASVCQN